MGQRVVLFPLPMKGHINPMLQLASMLHSKGFSISIICTKFNSPDLADYPTFTFHVINDGLSEAEASFQNDASFFTTINEKCEQPFKDNLSSLVKDDESPNLTCLIFDSFWHFARAVAHSLKLRAIILLPFNVACFRTFIAFGGTQKYISMQEKDMDIVIPELSPLRMKDLPKMNMQDPKQLDDLMLSINREIKNSDGIIFNSFKELETLDLAKLERDLTIPIFPCGPLQMVDNVENANRTTHKTKKKNACLSWLDQQHPNSVLYISLGTVVSLTKSEFRELAFGIATANRPFLWVVRSGLVQDSSSGINSLLPSKNELDKGLVVEWAPQKEVLSHRAVGAFLTHGGWNSIMESICAGVPMMCMPLLADQFATSRYVSEVWKIGVYFEEKIDRVSVQRAIGKLMDDGKESDEMRENAACLKDKVELSLRVGGSSYICLENLVQYISS